MGEGREEDMGEGIGALRWADISGLEGLYSVSDQGHILNLATGRILAHVSHTAGYPTVRLRGQRYYVHRLVCAAFNGSQAPGEEVAHLDGDVKNPAATNLAWVTRSENNRHKALHGTAQSGEQHPRVKLSAAQVSEIRQAREAHSILARRFGVNESAIRKIRSGERWTA